MDNLILIGMPGVGKSTVGVVLAKILAMDFVDTDLILQQRTGQKLQTLLDTCGLERFLAEEEAAIRSLHCRNTVIATGGSAVLSQDAMCHLQKLGQILYLKADDTSIEKRIGNLTTRGIAMRPGQTLCDVYRQRAPLYEAYATLTVNAASGSIQDVVAEILLKLG